MPGLRSRGRSFRPARAQRRMEWIGSATSGSTTLVAGDKIGFYTVLPSEARALTDPTLIRSIGSVVVCSTNVTVQIAGAFGLITWDDINDTVPLLGELPGPFTNPAADWIWHSYFFKNPLCAAQFNASVGGSGLDAQSKAMRRLGTHKGILFVAENSVGSGTSFAFMFGFRHLLKE